MATAEHLIEHLGGSAAIERVTGFPLTTIESWKSANFVPAWRRDKLFEMAREIGVPLVDADFPSVAERVSRKAPDRSDAPAQVAA